MIIKNQDEKNKVKTAAKINLECLLYLRDLVEPGIDGLEVDRKAEEFYKNKKVIPAFKGYMGYPATINFMINNQVIHCIPNKAQIVEDGDVVSIDTGCIYEGFYADQALSLGVGAVDEIDERLLNTGIQSVEAGCAQCKAGNTVGDIGFAQETVVKMAGFSVVHKFVGHEIGRNMHDPLKIPAYGNKNDGKVLPENILLCIENQVCEGTNQIITDADGWSTYTEDGKNAVTFEHMVIVGKKGAEVITTY